VFVPVPIQCIVCTYSKAIIFSSAAIGFMMSPSFFISSGATEYFINATYTVHSTSHEITITFLYQAINAQSTTVYLSTKFE
jgi:hypothetical protein